MLSCASRGCHLPGEETSVTRTAELQVLELAGRIVRCRKCPRLVRYCEQVARIKRRAYRDCTYWGRPVPGFGDARAELMIIGLAPGAHGANRTGRMFTGDRSGSFFTGNSIVRDSPAGRTRRIATTAFSCATRIFPPPPAVRRPANKPLPSEILNCAGYLEEELDLLKPRAVLALGAIAWNAYLALLVRRGEIPSRVSFRFAHGAEFKLPRDLPRLFASYHPSQQNTQTGRLTPVMFSNVLRRIRRMLHASPKTRVSE